MILRVGVIAAVLAASLSVAPMSASDGRPNASPGAVTAEAPSSLADHLEHLPIVVDGLPSAADLDAIAAYRRATVRNPDPLAEMFDASFDALEVADGDISAIDELRTLFIEDPGALTSEAGRQPVEAALRALAPDPRNADRLNNAAIAAWLYGITQALTSGDGYNWHLQQAAAAVLHAANRQFPGRRALLLNLAFLTTVMPGWDYAGAPYAEEALALDPGDVTARALLASIQSRQADAPQGADQAVTTLGPIVADPALASLGHALVGDAHLAAATIRQVEAPAASRRHASLAIAAYDLAVGLNADPALHAGRAKALERLAQLGEPAERLGRLAEAAAEQALAVELAPSSLDLTVELARLKHRAGDVDGLHTAAEAAVVLVIGGWDPRIDGARFVNAPLDDAVPEDRGFLGWSVGSGSDHLPVAPRGDLGTGAGVVVVATIPREPPGIDHEIASQFGPRSAWQLAFAGAILAGDPGEASSLEAAWNRSVPWRASWDSFVKAAAVKAEGPAPGAESKPLGFFIAETAFRRAAQFTTAADLCRQFGDLQCTGENEYHAGDPAAAIRDLQAAFRAAQEAAALDASDGPGPDLRMFVAAAAEAAGDLPTAELFLAMTAGANDAGAWRPLAALSAGNLRLDADDPSGAIAWYDLALATIEANQLAEFTDYHVNLTRALEFRGLRQVARNNRGVALLRSLQPGSESAPACDPGFARVRCEAALADIRAALGSDPDNAVYRMNEGWATRLLGRTEEARAALEAAVRLDATLYPAFNDLGILLALDGDAAGARAAFTASIAADPAYDLARWNLGILALREVPGGIVEGQVRLAEAIRLEPALRSAPLDFRSDNRTYRFGFEAPLPPTAAAAFGRTYSIGAVVLASAASLAALAQLQATLFGHGVLTAASSAQGRLERLGRGRTWRLRQRAFRRRLPRLGRAWLPWLGVGLLLIIVTGWQAAQASPATAGSAIVLAVLATLLALGAHEVGHLVAARAIGARLIPAAWGPGAVLSLLFLPVQAATGPFFAERIRRTRGGGPRAWRFHIAGPLANVLVGVVAYFLFLIEPMPVFRLIAQVQLAAIGYTLLPVRPLDGWVLQKEQPRLLLALGFGVVAAGTAFALGLI